MATRKPSAASLRRGRAHAAAAGGDDRYFSLLMFAPAWGRAGIMGAAIVGQAPDGKTPRASGRGAGRTGRRETRAGQSTSLSVPFIMAKWPGKEQK